MPKVLVPLADGCEEMEAVIVIDVLRRAGLEVVSAALDDGLTITASRGVKLLADTHWHDLHPDDFDAIILPGGVGGAKRLSEHPEVLEALRIFLASERLVGAICAAPLALQAAGLIADRRITSHPTTAEKLKPRRYSEDRVVVDGTLITSRGPGTSFEFALCVVSQLLGDAAAAAIAEPMMLPPGT